MTEQVIKNMNPVEIGEQLSALVDGELSPDQVRFLLRSVEAESDLARRWSSYHVISATLKREFVALPLERDFSANVWAKLDAQSVSAAVPRAYTALRWLGGGAIAAAVAVVALVVSRPPVEQAGQNGATVLAQQAVPAVPQPMLQPSRAYPPLAPVANPPLDANSVMQASYDSVLSNLYAPNGQMLSRNYLGDGAAPFVLRVQPYGQGQAPPFGPMPPPQATQSNHVSTQP